MAERRSIVWFDVGGFTRQTILRSSAGASATQAALLAQSNAAIQDFWEGTDVFPGGTATFATYPRVRDYASLLFADSLGLETYINLPAPKSGIFLADGVTVNAAAIAALITAVQAEIVTASLMPVTTYLGGIRRGKNPDA